MAELKERTIEKEFVPYDLALELKELGFEEPCFGSIDQIGYIHVKGSKSSPRGLMMYNTINCPTFSQAFRFFRERYKIRGFVTQKIAGDFGFAIYVPNKENPAGKPFNRVDEFTKHFTTYEGAELASIWKLIEIAKEQNAK